MKKYLLFLLTILRSFGIALLLISGSSMAFAQANEPYIYGEMGCGNGNYGIVKTTMNIIFSNNNIISLNYYYSKRQYPNAPADYQWGDFIDGYSSPQSLFMYGISYGKVLFSKYRFLRFIAKGGLTEGTVSTPADYQLHQSYMGPYYTFSYHKINVTGIVLDPTIEVTLNRGFGFSFGLYSNLNAISSAIGVDVCMMFGKLRSSRVDNKNH